jgi:hypothetical protein
MTTVLTPSVRHNLAFLQITLYAPLQNSQQVASSDPGPVVKKEPVHHLVQPILRQLKHPDAKAGRLSINRQPPPPSSRSCDKTAVAVAVAVAVVLPGTDGPPWLVAVRVNHHPPAARALVQVSSRTAVLPGALDTGLDPTDAYHKGSRNLLEANAALLKRY